MRGVLLLNACALLMGASPGKERCPAPDPPACNDPICLYKPHRLHPELFKAEVPDNWLHPDAIKLRSRDLSSLKVEAEQVYSFDCFSTELLTMLNEELENFYTKAAMYEIPIRRPNRQPAPSSDD